MKEVQLEQGARQCFTPRAGRPHGAKALHGLHGGYKAAPAHTYSCPRIMDPESRPSAQEGPARLRPRERHQTGVQPARRRFCVCL